MLISAIDSMSSEGKQSSIGKIMEMSQSFLRRQFSAARKITISKIDIKSNRSESTSVDVEPSWESTWCWDVTVTVDCPLRGACVWKHLVTRWIPSVCFPVKNMPIAAAVFPFLRFESLSSSDDIVSRGCQGHQWVWLQRRCSLIACDMKKGQFLHVHADNLLWNRCSSSCSTTVLALRLRPFFDACPIIFDNLPIHVSFISNHFSMHIRLLVDHFRWSSDSFSANFRFFFDQSPMHVRWFSTNFRSIFGTPLRRTVTMWAIFISDDDFY